MGNVEKKNKKSDYNTLTTRTATEKKETQDVGMVIGKFYEQPITHNRKKKNTTTTTTQAQNTSKIINKKM